MGTRSFYFNLTSIIIHVWNDLAPGVCQGHYANNHVGPRASKMLHFGRLSGRTWWPCQLRIRVGEKILFLRLKIRFKLTSGILAVEEPYLYYIIIIIIIIIIFRRLLKMSTFWLCFNRWWSARRKTPVTKTCPSPLHRWKAHVLGFLKVYKRRVSWKPNGGIHCPVRPSTSQITGCTQTFLFKMDDLPLRANHEVSRHR
jgi:hypothetical protein